LNLSGKRRAAWDFDIAVVRDVTAVPYCTVSVVAQQKAPPIKTAFCQGLSDS
jgi:hypothetical protein